MTVFWGVSILCLTTLTGIGVIVWMTVTRSRDRRNAREVIPLEAAVCILKENGDIIIRQRRGKSILGLVLGLIIGLGGLAFFVVQLSPSTGTNSAMPYSDKIWYLP